MSKIQTLPEKVINQIAAGEVVERPASVVKELIENAMDAGATHIDVDIQNGGLKLIKVSDDGEGMSPTDALLAVQKHATSKIHTVDDLTHLSSFGFRGEALSSIASVSHFELSTREKGALSGVSVKIKGGGKAQSLETGRPEGTTISIANLFFNTPARLKFMKRQSTEENHIFQVVATYSLAFPQVSFQLMLDGKRSLEATSSNFKNRLSQVLGKEKAAALIPLDLRSGDIQVKGAVSTPTVTQPTRENMLFFVNNRWISNPSLGHAVMTGFHTLLPTRRFPVAILFIEMPHESVDVNVHPTKKEVKFSKDREVYDAVVKAIRGALLSTTGALTEPGAIPQNPTVVLQADYPKKEGNYPFAQEIQTTLTSQSTASSFVTAFTSLVDQAPIGHGMTLDKDTTGKSQLSAKKIDPQVSLYNFSQMFNTFIVFQSDSELYIADQHTVHERLNYEKFMKAVREKTIEIQPLLVPATVELNPKEANVLKNHLETLLELGMEVAPFGGNTFLIRSVPSDLAGKNIVKLLQDLLEDLSAEESTGIKGRNSMEQSRERTATFMACRSSVMAGDRLNDEQMKGLIDRMREANLPFTCPHGRPTILSIPLTELYRRFDRH
jgi:DNA mismatch repair protein MutL